MPTFGPASQIGDGNLSIQMPSSGAAVGRILVLASGSGNDWVASLSSIATILGYTPVDLTVFNNTVSGILDTFTSLADEVAINDTNALHKTGNETKTGNLTLVGVTTLRGNASQTNLVNFETPASVVGGFVNKDGNRLGLGRHAGLDVVLGTGPALLVGCKSGDGDRAGFYLSHQDAASGFGFMFFANGSTYLDNYGGAPIIIRMGAAYTQIAQFTTSGTQFVCYSASSVGVAVIGAASQSANLQEWRNASNVVLASISASGGASFALQKTGIYTVSTLPTASLNDRSEAWVTDSTLPHVAANIGATVAGGGSYKTPVRSNGTNWVIG